MTERHEEAFQQAEDALGVPVEWLKGWTLREAFVAAERGHAVVYWGSWSAEDLKVRCER